DIEKVVSDLIRWFPGSGHQSLRRAFAAWLGQVLLPARFPEGEFPQIEKLQEVKSMLAERVREWPREWEERGWNRGLREGREEGRKEGREEGLQQGIRLGEARLLEQQLRQKFGKPSKTLRDRISNADSQTLSEWADRVLTAETLDQVLNGQ
ncbi:MAG: transposase, partial [Acidobacteriota bacterium]